MPIKYHYDKKLKIIHSCPYGDLQMSEILNHFIVVAGDPNIGTGVVELVNFENVEIFQFGAEETSQIPYSYKELKDKKNIESTIFIANATYQFGVARMVQTWFEILGEGSNISIVPNEDDAMEIYRRLKG